jgi:hypothetical protein
VTPSRRRLLVLAAAVAFCGAAFYFALTRTLEFAVASHLRYLIDGLSPTGRATFVAVISHLPVDEDPAAWIVRKAASIVFFGSVGAMARVFAADRVKSARSEALLVVGAAFVMSLAIEIYEYPETLGNEAFDLTCGLVGGLLALAAIRLFRRRT